MSSDAEFRILIRRSISRRRNVLVAGIAKKFLENQEFLKASGFREAGLELASEWISISSLSQLRKATGGRFQNLKERWVKAGFPLRQHRGDKSESWTLSEEGWLALSLWINKQGFEARLSGCPKDVIFEIRKTIDR